MLVTTTPTPIRHSKHVATRSRFGLLVRHLRLLAAAFRRAMREPIDPYTADVAAMASLPGELPPGGGR